MKVYAQDLDGLLKESENTEWKAFIRSFVERIDVDPQNVTVHYNLLLSLDKKAWNLPEVLPVITFGGDRE